MPMYRALAPFYPMLKARQIFLFWFRFSLAASQGRQDDALQEQGISNEAILSHKATTAEIKALVSDLQVLGRSEFKALLRW